jgi:hypothetical protein
MGRDAEVDCARGQRHSLAAAWAKRSLRAEDVNRRLDSIDRMGTQERARRA